MANGWTLERRERQSALIRQWRPWEKSTGPKSEEGKRVSAMRGYKGGQRQAMINLAKAMQEAKDTVSRLQIDLRRHS